MKRLLRPIIVWALGVSVRVKIMGIALGLVLLLGVGAVIQVQGVTRATFTREMDEIGRASCRERV